MQKDKLLKVLELLEAEKQLEENLESFLAAIAQDNGVDVNDLKQTVNISGVVSDLADANEGYFTDDELDAFIAFFSSPLGTSILQKLSSFTEDVSHFASAMVEKKLNDFFAARMSVPPGHSDNSGNSGLN